MEESMSHPSSHLLQKKPMLTLTPAFEALP